MSELYLDSSIPVSEEQALSGKPLRWRIDKIKMETNLLSYHSYQIFMQACQTVKFQMRIGADVKVLNMSEILDIQDDNTKKILIEMHESLRAFKEERGIWPYNLVECLVSISMPLEWEHLRHVLGEWVVSSPYNYVIDEKTEKSDLMKYLVLYSMRAIDIREFIAMVDLLSRANSEVKKKLQSPPVQARQKTNDPFWELAMRLDRVNSRSRRNKSKMTIH